MILRYMITAALTILPAVLSHSWIDNISNGNNVGFIRGYMGHLDKFETYQVLNSDKGVALCAANQLNPTNYTSQFPRLQVKAGDKIVANYTENGHVTQDKLPPDNKPHPGNYSWFWTGIPFTGSMTDGSQFATFDSLNESNRLSGPSNFDDGRCAQSDSNSLGRTGPTNCQSHFQIPEGTAPGIYALYWVWDFTKLTAVDPSYLELYTSCMDVEVVADNSTGPSSLAGGSIQGPTAVTRTRMSTKTIVGPAVTVTKKVHGSRTPTAKPQNVELTTLYTETIITVTKTVTVIDESG